MASYDFLYVVDWGNGFFGGFDKNFNQEFNVPARNLEHDLQSYRMEHRVIRAITPQRLDELRGYHKPTLAQYFGVSE